MEYFSRVLDGQSEGNPEEKPLWQVLEGRTVIAVCPEECDADRIVDALTAFEDILLGKFIKKEVADDQVNTAVKVARSNFRGFLFRNKSDGSSGGLDDEIPF